MSLYIVNRCTTQLFEIIHRVKLRHRIYGLDTTAILWVWHGIMCGVKGRKFIVLFAQHLIRWFMKMPVWSLACQQSVFQRYYSENISKSFAGLRQTRVDDRARELQVESRYLWDRDFDVGWEDRTFWNSRDVTRALRTGDGTASALSTIVDESLSSSTRQFFMQNRC